MINIDKFNKAMTILISTMTLLIISLSLTVGYLIYDSKSPDTQVKFDMIDNDDVKVTYEQRKSGYAIVIVDNADAELEASTQIPDGKYIQGFYFKK